MDFEQAREVLSKIQSGRQSDEEYSRTLEEFILAAVRYARKRVDWQLADFPDRLELERSRKFAHDAFIDSCNILYSCMKKKEMPSEWRFEIGEDRQVLGDFACHIHCLLGIRAR